MVRATKPKAAKPEPAAEHEPPLVLVPTQAVIPSRRSIPALSKAVHLCRGCPLYAKATQAVFGEGPSSASVVLVGEQPGDMEDREGRPFVGPAGDVLARALEAAGIDRGNVYVTNAVKHFNFEPRGKARLHKRPRPGDVRACRPWLEAELETIRPQALVLLGATAAQAVLGSVFRVTAERGVPRATEWAPVTLATWHPSMVLRAPDSDARKRMFAELSSDLSQVARVAKAARRSTG